MRLSFLLLSSACVGVTLLAACGSSVTEPDSTGSASGPGATGAATSSGAGGSGSTSSSATGATTGTGGSSTPCPPSYPEDGVPCPQEGLVCEYEDGPIVDCRGAAYCSGGAWYVELPGCSSHPPDDNCPAEPPAPMLCDFDGTICEYGDGTLCGCTSCAGGPCGMDAYWSCAPPPGGGCPATAPLLGQPCEGALECLYGGCGLGTATLRICADGIWVAEGVECPV